MINEKVFLAKRKGERTHAYIRLCRKTQVLDKETSVSAETLNEFLLARDPEEFTRSISAFGPLFYSPICKREISDVPRISTVAEFRDSFERRYESPNAEILLEEFTGLKYNWSEENKSATDRTCKTFDALKNNGLLNYLTSEMNDDDFVVVDTVLDWRTAQTLASCVLLSKAYLDRATAGIGFEEKTVHFGYWMIKPSLLGKKEARPVKQIGFNPGWAEETAIRQLKADLSKDSGSNNPLLYLFSSFPNTGSALDAWQLKGSAYIKIKGAESLKGIPLPLLNKARQTVVDRSLFFVADSGCSEETIAKDLLRSILQTTSDLSSAKDGDSLGWSFDYSLIREGSSGPTPVFGSQFARIIYFAAFHGPRYKAEVCWNCERPMLCDTNNKPRHFCRTSCTNAYSVKQKKEN